MAQEFYIQFNFMALHLVAELQIKICKLDGICIPLLPWQQAWNWASVKLKSVNFYQIDLEANCIILLP